MRAFKVILSLTNIELDSALKLGLSCVIEASGMQTVAELPFKEVFVLDLKPGTLYLNVIFQKDGHELIRGKIHVPEKVNSQVEVETTDTVKNNISNPMFMAFDPKFRADFNLTYINTNLFEPPAIAEELEESIDLRDLSNGKVDKRTTKAAKEKLEKYRHTIGHTESAPKVVKNPEASPQTRSKRSNSGSSLRRVPKNSSPMPPNVPKCSTLRGIKRRTNSFGGVESFQSTGSIQSGTSP
jgi:hypothetical protein